MNPLPAVQPIHEKRTLWMLRLYYFIWLGGSCFILPFINLYFTRQGLSGQQIGLINSVSAIAMLIASPIWTRWSEQSRHPRLVLQFALIFTGLCWIWLGNLKIFGLILLVSTLKTLPDSGIWPISDNLALSLTQQIRAGFGSVRVWGSIGCAVLVLVAGWMVERLGLYSGFIAQAAAMFLSALILLWIPVDQFQTQSTPSEKMEQGMGVVLRGLLSNPSLLGFGFMLILIGTGHTGILQFEAVYLDQLGARESLIGVASMLGPAVEIPAMFWADRLLRKVSADFLLLTSLMLNAILFSLVSLWPAIITILISRLISGVAFSFYTVAMVGFIGQRSPASQRATLLAIFNVTIAGLVSIVASPLSGMAFDAWGGRALYLLAMLSYVAGWIVLRVTHRLKARTAVESLSPLNTP